MNSANSRTNPVSVITAIMKRPRNKKMARLKIIFESDAERRAIIERKQQAPPLQHYLPKIFQSSPIPALRAISPHPTARRRIVFRVELLLQATKSRRGISWRPPDKEAERIKVRGVARPFFQVSQRSLFIRWPEHSFVFLHSPARCHVSKMPSRDQTRFGKPFVKSP